MFNFLSRLGVPEDIKLTSCCFVLITLFSYLKTAEAIVKKSNFCSLIKIKEDSRLRERVSMLCIFFAKTFF